MKGPGPGGRGSGGIVFAAARRALDALGLGSVRPPAASRLDGTFRASGVSCVSVGLGGDVVGALVVSFSPGRVNGLASALAQEPIGADDEEGIRCAMAELANVVAGYAATDFDEVGVSVHITPPTAITGPEIHLDFPKEAENVVESFELLAGSFDLVVSLCDRPGASHDPGRPLGPQRFRLLRGLPRHPG